MSWSTHSRQLTAAMLGLALLTGGCKKKDNSDTETAAVPVQAEHPTTGPMHEEIAADAILAPLAQAAIAPKVTAPIRAEYVQRGTRVRKGQLLLTLEDRDLRGAALDSRGGLDSAEATYTATVQASIPEDAQKASLDLDQAKANLALANRTADERKRLLKEGAISARDTETAIAAAVQAQAAYDTALKHLSSVQHTTTKTTFEAAKGQLTSAQGKLASAEAQVSYANIHSPIDGVVTDRPLFPGETAQAGAPVITVMETSSLLAKLHIAQSAAQQLKVGGEAELAVPGIADPQPATVSLVSPALDPGSTTVEVWLKLPNPDGRYKVGTPVHATIHGANADNAIQLPASAILPADDGSTNVLVVGGDSTAHKRAVKVGIRNGDKVQILDGITTSDLVITEGGYGLDDGTKVKVGSGKDKGDDAGGKPSPAGDKD